MKGGHSAHADFGIRRLTLGWLGSTYSFKAEGSLASLFLILVILKGVFGGFFFFLSLLKQMHVSLVIYLKALYSIWKHNPLWVVSGHPGLSEVSPFWAVTWHVPGEDSLTLDCLAKWWQGSPHTWPLKTLWAQTVEIKTPSKMASSGHTVSWGTPSRSFSACLCSENPSPQCFSCSFLGGDSPQYRLI